MNNADTAKVRRKSGRREVLTPEIAKKIAAMVRRLPDAKVPITWKNIEGHVRKNFAIAPKRNVLATKEWDGKKLIWEAYKEACEVERRLQRQITSKYADSSRAALRARIMQLEAKIVGLQTELDVTRLRQYDELTVLWARNTPLRELVESHRGT